MKNFQDRLSARMLELGIKQVDIVKKTGASKTSVSRWLNGTVPRGEALTVLSECLKVTPEWLMGKSAMSSAVKLTWCGPGEQLTNIELPKIVMAPFATVDPETGSWVLQKEVFIWSIKEDAANPAERKMFQDLNGIVVFRSIGSSTYGILVVDTKITGHCSEMDFNPAEGERYMAMWHGKPMILNFGLTATGDISLTSDDNANFRSEVIAKEDVSRVKVNILGKVVAGTFTTT